MHQAFKHLAKRVLEAQSALTAVITEVEKQNERETKTLEDVAYSREFNAEQTPIQENIVASLQTTLEALYHADDDLTSATRTLDEMADL